MSESEVSIPYYILDERINDDTDTQQHKAHRGQRLHKKSIRQYRHATTKWGAALENFTPLWFAICISSGGLGILLNAPFPYHSHWQVVLSTIFYLTDVVLFLLFMTLTIARWIVYPHVAVRKALTDPDELNAYAIAPIALLTISALTISQVSEGPWGGHAWTIVGYVMWWIATMWVFLMTVVVFVVLIYTGNVVDRTMSPLLLMAPVGLATAATEGGFITIYGAGMSARLAFPQIIVSYFALGIAIFMALLVYAIFLHRLLAAGLIESSKRAGLFLLIGPFGQFSTALQLLGLSANQYMHFANYKPSSYHPPDRGTFTTQQTAQGIDGAGILLALMFLGFDFFWLAIALVGVADVFIKKQASYSLSWWSVVFPCVVFTTAMLELSNSMDSPAFRAIVSLMTVLIAVFYTVNWVFTIQGIVTGKMIFGQSQAEKEDEMVEKARKQSKKDDDA